MKHEENQEMITNRKLVKENLYIKNVGTGFEQTDFGEVSHIHNTVAQFSHTRMLLCISNQLKS